MRDEDGRWKWKTGKGRKDTVSPYCYVFRQFAEPGRDVSEEKSPTGLCSCSASGISSIVSRHDEFIPNTSVWSYLPMWQKELVYANLIKSDLAAPQTLNDHGDGINRITPAAARAMRSGCRNTPTSRIARFTSRVIRKACCSARRYSRRRYNSK